MSKPPRKPRRKLFEPMRLNLPEHTGLSGIEVFTELQRQLQPLLGEGGAFTPRLQARREAIRGHVHGGGHLLDALRDAADARVLLALWREEADFLRIAPLDKDVVAWFKRHLPVPPPRLLLWQLIRFYLEQYDTLPGWKELGAWLGDSLARLPVRDGETAHMRACREQRKGLFGKDAPGALVRYAERAKRDFYSAAREWHLADTSRVYVLACRRYYLEPLQKLKLGQEHPLFGELARPEVHTQAMPDTLLLGHHVCRLLMDKLIQEHAELPENWRHLILAIMGDPRVPRGAPQFQAWWGRLEKKYVQAMRTWLSRLDLNLFLNILEEVGRTHDKQDLLRMFPARKRFLEGLHKLGLIRSSRLLLGTQAEKYVREHFDLHDLPEFASLGISDVSLIYLDLGDAHLLEGTHAFQARVYPALPIPGLADYESEKFSLSAIRKYQSPYSVRHTHSPLPRWQHELIDILGVFNLEIDPQTVLSEEDYQAYRKVFM